MLMLRLQRVGKTKHPTYRLVVSEKNRDTQYTSLEILGVYDPTKKPKVVNFKNERVLHWLSKGAQASTTVHNLLLGIELIKGEKQNSVSISNKRKAKMEKKAAA